MNKKILIGSIIAVVILLFIQSIPAIQQNAIEDRTYNDLIENDDNQILTVRVKHFFGIMIGSIENLSRFNNFEYMHCNAKQVYVKGLDIQPDPNLRIEEWIMGDRIEINRWVRLGIITRNFIFILTLEARW